MYLARVRFCRLGRLGNLERAFTADLGDLALAKRGHSRHPRTNLRVFLHERSGNRVVRVEPEAVIHAEVGDRRCTTYQEVGVEPRLELCQVMIEKALRDLRVVRRNRPAPRKLRTIFLKS